MEKPSRDFEAVLRLEWDEYLRLEDPPTARLEYEHGRLIVSPTGANAHDLLIGILVSIFDRYEESAATRACIAMSEHSFFMPPGERDLRPDLGVITDQRKDRPLPRKGWIDGAPNIAIEVLSPSTEKRDRTFKAARYFEEGTSEYWLFDPIGEAAEFLRRGASDWEPVAAVEDRYATDLLPGFELSLPDLWRRLRRKLGEPA